MVLTAEQIRAVEARAVELDMSWLRLMENAGSAAAHIIRENYALDGKKVVIVCGKGNNGGDGYVIARKLLENNAQVRIISLGTPSTPSASEMALKSYNLGIKPIDYVSYSEISNRFISDADIIVDAIFGIGFNGCAKGKYADVINAINDSNAVKICIDVPSGMTSDNGICDGITVKANATVTFATYKPCHLLPPSNELCGKVIVTQIGIPDAAYLVVDPVMHVASTDKVCIALPDRTVNFHKGDCGTAALFCGAKGYSGAAVIAAKSAVRSGAGIVNVIIPESIYPIVGASVHEAVCTVYNDVAEDTVRDDITEHIIATIDRSDIALIGCGLGQSKQTSYTIKEILKNCSVPIVIDADGINCLTGSIELIRQYTNEVIITPHPKEASRLLGCSVADVQKDRLHAVKKLAQITNAVSILKGANTLIALPDGTVYVVTDGNPGMATAGTGDMLAGMIAAFCAQGLSAADAAICGVKIHALAGDEALKQASLLSLTPTDMINSLHAVYCRLYSKK